MEDVSIERALSAGFGLIRRHPAAVAVWALVYIVLGLLPQYGLTAAIMPAQLRSLQATGGGLPAAELMQTQSLLSSAQLLAGLLGLVVQTLLLGAAYRAVLFPEEGGFFYLRVGLREVWLFLVLAVLLIGFILLFVVAVLPVALIGGIAGAAGGAAVGGLLAVLGAFIAIGVVIWAALRMSLAPPMSFAERGFKLFESWGKTRGQGLRLFAVAAVIVVLMIVAELVVGIVGFLLLGGPARMADIAKLASQPQAMFTAMAPIAIAFGLVLSVLSVMFYALIGGAWAEIYRHLNPTFEDVF